MEWGIGLILTTQFSLLPYTRSRMDEFLATMLKWMNGDPRHLGDVFDNTLTHRDELMLTNIDRELGQIVEGILDRVLAGANIHGEMQLGQTQRDRVFELTAIRKEIHILIRERGTLLPFQDGMN